MGLRIMHYRASTIGASLEIKPFDHAGTLVTCMLPVKTNVRNSRAAVASTGEADPDSRHESSELKTASSEPAEKMP
jgi:hypothetical protein